jgi:membrane protease YdiL (CAAX protease family)
VRSTLTHETERLSIRQLLYCPRPGFVAASVLAISIAVFGYVAFLILILDARTWWGRDLLGMALAFLAMFAVAGALTWRGCGERRLLVGFLAVSWFVVTMVSWLPRQQPSAEGLTRLSWWTGWSIVLYVVPPALFAFLTHQRIRSYGLSLGTFAGETRIFAVMIPVIAAATWFASSQPHFQVVYPFYKGWPDGDAHVTSLLIWWAMYAASFVALEFFFRGFMVIAGHRVMGWWAIPAMAAPYCLLHLDKPVPEMVSSLFGGLILGVVALRTRSILAGVLAHVSLAIGTDAAVLGRRFID